MVTGKKNSLVMGKLLYKTVHTEDGMQEQPITLFMARSVLLALFYGSCQSLTSRMAK